MVVVKGYDELKFCYQCPYSDGGIDNNGFCRLSQQEVDLETKACKMFDDLLFDAELDEVFRILEINK